MKKNAPRFNRLLVLSVFLLPQMLFGQLSFEKTYGTHYTDMGSAMQQTYDGGFVITGVTYSTGGGDVLLIKTDAAGDTVFTKTYGGIYEDWGISIQQTPDSGFIIAGYTTPDVSGQYDIYLIRTDAHGDTLWTKSYGGSENDDAHSVAVLSAGGLIVTGHTQSTGAGNGDVFLLRTDAGGNTVWMKTFGGNFYDWGNAVKETFDGGYIVAGYTLGSSAGDFYIIRTDEAGDTLWTKLYGGINSDRATDIVQTPDSGFVIVGATESFGAGAGDVYLVKINTTGDTLWTKTIGGAAYDEGNSIAQAADSGFIIAGRTFSYGAGGADVYVVRTNAMGDTLWTKTFGGASTDWSGAVVETNTDGYAVAGYTMSFGAGLNDVYLIRNDTAEMITGFEDDDTATDWKIFPNPSIGTIHVQALRKSNASIQITISNIFGQQIFVDETETDMAIDISATSIYAGICFVSIREGTRRTTQKLIIGK